VPNSGYKQKACHNFCSHLDSFIMTPNFKPFSNFVMPALDSSCYRDRFIFRRDLQKLRHTLFVCRSFSEGVPCTVTVFPPSRLKSFRWAKLATVPGLCPVLASGNTPSPSRSACGTRMLVTL
jgi:hypothetical protein